MGQNLLDWASQYTDLSDLGRKLWTWLEEDQWHIPVKNKLTVVITCLKIYENSKCHKVFQSIVLTIDLYYTNNIYIEREREGKRKWDKRHETNTPYDFRHLRCFLARMSTYKM